MSCRFRLRLNHNITETYQVALLEIKRFGAKYVGDDNGGKFEVTVLGMRFKGVVRVEGSILLVEIVDKPLLIPCALIESSTKSYIASMQ